MKTKNKARKAIRKELRKACKKLQYLYNLLSETETLDDGNLRRDFIGAIITVKRFSKKERA